MSERPKPEPKSAFKWFTPIQTRWSDNDIYGHVNNVTYYSYFDTAVNKMLIEKGQLDLGVQSIVGLAVSSSCTYFSSVSYPDELTAGVRLAKLGNSSLHYQVGIFGPDQDMCAALGNFVHVFVDGETRKPTPLPQEWREALNDLTV